MADINSHLFFFVVGQEPAKLIDRFGRDNKPEINGFVTDFFRLYRRTAFCKLEAVTGYPFQTVLCDIDITTVQDGALVIDSHRKRNLCKHLFQGCLGKNKAVVAGQTGNFREIFGAERIHFVRRGSANDIGNHFFADAQLNLVPFHDTDCLAEFVGVDDALSGFFHPARYRNTNSFFKVIGCHDAAVLLGCFQQNPFCGRIGGFADRAQKRRDHIGQFLAVK